MRAAFSNNHTPYCVKDCFPGQNGTSIGTGGGGGVTE